MAGHSSIQRCKPSAAVQAKTSPKPTTDKVQEVVPPQKLLVFNVTWLFESFAAVFASDLEKEVGVAWWWFHN